jgi:hypothetical protein
MTINTTTPGTEADIDLDKLRSDFEAWFHKYSPRTNLSRVNGIYEAENLNHLWRNFCAEAGVGLPGARRAAPPTAELPAILFDGKAVLDEVKAHATNALRTGPENVVDVLDAVVRLMRRAAPLAHPIGQGSVTLTGNQLRAALDFINPDGPGDEDQCNDELTFGIRQHRDDEGKVDTGMCCWNNDMDGEVFPLPDEYATPSSTDSAQAAVEEVRTDAARDVLAERRRQVEAEGWTLEGDDQYDGGELSLAAACYALAGDPPYARVPADWPWDYGWWKPVDDRRNLVKAAALILADIERIDRSTAAQAATKGDKS